MMTDWQYVEMTDWHSGVNEIHETHTHAVIAHPLAGTCITKHSPQLPDLSFPCGALMDQSMLMLWQKVITELKKLLDCLA